jgi:transposase
MAPIHVPQPEKKTSSEGAALIFEDEASFRQDSTLYQTWAPIGSQPQIPVTGQRKSVKIFGAVEVYTAQFTYHRANVFNAATYLVFLEQLARRYFPKRTHLIQDNASYHKDATVWGWFKDNRRWLEVHPLPAYSPELNATERLWHHTRVAGTHNRYFVNEAELVGTLQRVFRSIQHNPIQIRGYLRPFC